MPPSYNIHNVFKPFLINLSGGTKKALHFSFMDKCEIAALRSSKDGHLHSLLCYAIQIGDSDIFRPFTDPLIQVMKNSPGGGRFAP
jgi:hypothetical protein